MGRRMKITFAFGVFFLFMLLTISLMTIDVRVIGETNKEIGIGFINKLSVGIEYNKTLDLFSDIFMYLSIGLIIFFAGLGFIQLIKRKSILKVDREILLFGILLILVAVLWLVFDKFILINYRPILIDGELEPSYPSTHVLLVTFILPTSASIASKYVKKSNIIKFIYIMAILCSALTFVLRFLSGVHWLTDCIGGALLGVLCFQINNIFLQKDRVLP
jgi:undecaprenyl-diphosphatase